MSAQNPRSIPRNRVDIPSDSAAGHSLLSPVAYDDDASSIHSRSEQDSDSDDDELQLRARNSRELRAADRIVLHEEEDLERLVTDTRRQQERSRRGSGLVVPNPLKLLGRRRGSSTSPGPGGRLSATSSTEDLGLGTVSEKRHSRRARRQEKKKRLLESAENGEDGELMYEMEEGGMKEGSSTGESSDRGEDSDEMAGMITSEKPTRRRRWRRWVLIHSLIAIGFAILVLVAWKLSKSRKTGPFVKPDMVSNGTSLFAPTTIIISLDGFRADFLQRGLTPRLSAFIKEGVSPKYMLPSFPSVTFPNHYTLATGLYPESHGVVSNTFWDPDLQAEFHYTDPARSLDPKWWGGEPFWVTAEKQGIRTGIHMWPGSEAHILDIEPSFLDKFNGKEELQKKVWRIMELLDKPGLQDEAATADNTRPQLIAAYVPNVDSDGHMYGPNSTEIRATIQSADTFIEQVFEGLEERNLTEIVNVIVVSDHGMATTDVERLLQLEDLVGSFEIEHIDGWPLYGLRTKSADDLRPLYDHLKTQEDGAPWNVYLRDEDMPERYHFSRNDRIAPLWIMPQTGWAIVTKEEFNVAEAKEQGLVYHPRGLHGYDNEHPLMRAIFVARGPAFPHPANSEIEVFQNLEVYNLLCDSLGMEPAPNNGTLRLPLKPIGTHKDEDTPEIPEDPVTTITPSTTSTSISPKTSSSSSTSTSIAPPDLPTTTSEAPPLSRPTVPSNDNEDEEEDEEEEQKSTIGVWWEWVKDKVGEVIHTITGGGDDKDSDSDSKEG